MRTKTESMCSISGDATLKLALKISIQASRWCSSDEGKFVFILKLFEMKRQ